MIRYPEDYNPIREYWEQIENGEVVVGEKIRETYRKLIKDMETKVSVYYYSHSRANHVIEFIENFCKHSKGKVAGKPVILELWEKAMLAAVFGFIDIEGCRKYREAILIVAKKNGKSLISSCVGLYMQVADGEGGPEIYSVATKKDQAKIIWNESKRMVKKSPALSRRIKALVAELSSENFNDGTFKPLASDSDTLDGLNVHCVLMDEIHQWKNGKALYDIMYDGTTARDQPLTFITSTAGTVREDIYDLKYEEIENLILGYRDDNGYKDDSMIAFVYELDNRKEWTDEKCWQKANPGLGTIKNRKQLAAKVEKAKANRLLVKNLLCKEFNIRETSTESWLSYDHLNNKEKFDLKELKPRYAIGGADLSSTTDLTNATAIFKVPDDDRLYVLQMYWLPEDLLEERTKEDKIPYDIWCDMGLMRTTPGNKVHYKYVTEWFLELQNEFDIYVPWVGYDSWSATYWVEDMKNNFGKEAMEKVIQGKQTLSEPMKSLGADLKAKKIVYNNSPILKWCLSNTSKKEDDNGNIQPVKGTSPRKRIDGTAGLLNAYVALGRHYDEYMNMI